MPAGNRQEVSRMSAKALFERMMGKWGGKCRTWFEPGQLADESNMTGDIMEVLDGRFLRHTYESTIEGKMRHGEELIAFNSVTKTYQSCWIDDFHMNYAIMFSEGSVSDSGFIVYGQYDAAPNLEDGVRTVG